MKLTIGFLNKNDGLPGDDGQEGTDNNNHE